LENPAPQHIATLLFPARDAALASDPSPARNLSRARMITLLSLLCLGFFLGMKHATDADHVVAVTAIVSQQRSIRGAALTGLFWGIGHSLTMLVVGGTIVLCGIVVPARLGLSLELSVALMLIVLGALNLRSAGRWFAEARHGHAHAEDEDAPVRFDRWFGQFRAYQIFRPFFVGVVHGLAGSATIALLVLPVIRDAGSAMAYLLVFGVGTIAGMMSITAAIALPFRYAAGRSPVLQRFLGGAAGIGSCGFGLFLVYQIGFVEKLFIH
jgi:high-affinity nickel-transport protein